MQYILEMTVSPVYTGPAVRRLRLLRLLRIALVVCLVMSWIYGIAVTVAFAPVSQADPHPGQTVRVLLQPNEAFCERLKAYVPCHRNHSKT